MLEKHLPQDICDRYKEVIPIPIVDIARDLGLRIYETHDFTKQESGSLRNEDGTYIIYVNAEHSSTKKRFTIGHEIGHFLKHKDLIGPNTEHVDTVQRILDKNTLYRKDHPMTDEEERMEIEANAVAADLLMPEHLFIAAFHETNDIEELAEHFWVSPAAAAFRAKVLLGITIV